MNPATRGGRTGTQCSCVSQPVNCCVPVRPPRVAGFIRPGPTNTMSTDSIEDPQSAAVEQLERFGLSTYAVRTFVAVARLGSGTARDVSQVSEVPRTRVYDAIDELRPGTRRYPALLTQTVLGDLFRNSEPNVQTRTPAPHRNTADCAERGRTGPAPSGTARRLDGRGTDSHHKPCAGVFRQRGRRDRVYDCRGPPD